MRFHKTGRYENLLTWFDPFPSSRGRIHIAMHVSTRVEYQHLLISASLNAGVGCRLKESFGEETTHLFLCPRTLKGVYKISSLMIESIFVTIPASRVKISQNICLIH